MISKAQAIRNVAKQDCSITNGHVKQLVKERYGLEVQTNQINNTIGSYADRKTQGPAHQTLLGIAEGLVKACGNDRRRAAMLINTV